MTGKYKRRRTCRWCLRLLVWRGKVTICRRCPREQLGERRKRRRVWTAHFPHCVVTGCREMARLGGPGYR